MRKYIIAVAMIGMLLMVSPAFAAETAEAGPLDKLGINFGFMLSQFFHFALLFTFLLVGLWRPMTNMLDSRAAKIEKGLEDASKAANALKNAEAEAEKLLVTARADANKIIEEARGRGDEVAKAIEAEARNSAEKIRAEGRSQVDVERTQQLGALRGEVSNISIAVAQRLIGEALDKKRQESLINDFFSKVPADAKNMTGKVEVVSAMPLDNAEQDRVKKEIGNTDVTFRVDPAILGGLIIRTEDRVVDGSVRRDLNTLATRLN
ncbi:MAG: F0F1 ATP synthase subunit B [Phototrophicales bacterium]|nr:F0F1 ATP synthase subunit B [Phototrophicales bacterium]